MDIPPASGNGTASPIEHDVDPVSCSLLGTVGLVVQGLMGLFVIASLLFKRQYEGDKKKGKRRRKWRVWMMDVGKQLIGQGMVHGLNLLISDQVAYHGNENACSLYFLNVLIDTTIGVLIMWLSLKGLTAASVRIWGPEGFESGVYGDPPRPDYFARQLGVYLAAMIVMKIGVLLLFWIALDHVLLPVASWVLDWMRPWSQVVFVEALFPLTMNVIQFWIIDTIIRSSGDLYVVQAKDFEELPSSTPASPIAPLISPFDRRRRSKADPSDGYGSTSESGSPAMMPQDHDADELDAMEDACQDKSHKDVVQDPSNDRLPRSSISRISDVDRRIARRSLSSDFGRTTKVARGEEQELTTRPR